MINYKSTDVEDGFPDVAHFDACTGSLGHVLSDGLSYLILQVGRLLPISLQLQPLKVWHLQKDTRDAGQRGAGSHLKLNN